MTSTSSQHTDVFVSHILPAGSIHQHPWHQNEVSTYPCVCMCVCGCSTPLTGFRTLLKIHPGLENRALSRNPAAPHSSSNSNSYGSASLLRGGTGDVYQPLYAHIWRPCRLVELAMFGRNSTNSAATTVQHQGCNNVTPTGGKADLG
jgi:hypothetical protein